MTRTKNSMNRPARMAECAVALAVVAALAGGTLGAAEKEPSSRPKPRSPRLARRLPPVKNIFFPAASVAETPTVKSKTLIEEDFILRATFLSPKEKKARLEFPATGRWEWIKEGQSVSDVTVVEIRHGGMTVELGGQSHELAVGRHGTDLLAGRQAFPGKYKLLGVCRSGDKQFALVRFAGTEDVRRVTIGDKLGKETIVGIGEAAVTVSSHADFPPRTISVHPTPPKEMPND